MSERHFSDEAMLALLDGDGHWVDIDAMRVHVAACDECGEHLRELETFIGALADAETWRLLLSVEHSSGLGQIADFVRDGLLDEEAARDT